MSSVILTVVDADGSVRTRKLGVAVTDGNSTDIVSIKDDKANITSYEIYSLDGKLVKSALYNNVSVLNGLNCGVYLMKLIDSLGKAYTVKIVKD